MALVGASSTANHGYSEPSNKQLRLDMTADERERMNWLCQRIQDEKNPKSSMSL